MKSGKLPQLVSLESVVNEINHSTADCYWLLELLLDCYLLVVSS